MITTIPAASQNPSNTLPKHILFAGDGTLTGPAACLASVLLEEGYALTHLSSDETFPAYLDLSLFSLIILSDYHGSHISETLQKKIVLWTLSGGSLLMVGGFVSFTGMEHCYYDMPLADILPVELSELDDRRNVPQGLVPFTPPAGSIFEKLDFSNPPVICGYNELQPSAEARIELSGRRLILSQAEGQAVATFDSIEIPLCVSAVMGSGKSTALAFDLAPHWVGGMIDWGDTRSTIDRAGRPVEMGCDYYQFTKVLIQSCIQP